MKWNILMEEIFERRGEVDVFVRVLEKAVKCCAF